MKPKYCKGLASSGGLQPSLDVSTPFYYVLWLTGPAVITHYSLLSGPGWLWPKPPQGKIKHSLPYVHRHPLVRCTLRSFFHGPSHIHLPRVQPVRSWLSPCCALTISRCQAWDLSWQHLGKQASSADLPPSLMKLANGEFLLFHLRRWLWLTCLHKLYGKLFPCYSYLLIPVLL